MSLRTPVAAQSKPTRWSHLPGVLSLVLLGAAAGCAKTGTSMAVTTSASPSTNPGNACDRKLISKDDVAGLLAEPIAKEEALQGDPQSCVFTTTGFSTVTVSLRPGVGEVTVSATLAGKTNVSADPVKGVGDRAAWTSVLKEINATKNNTLCNVNAIGPATGGATEEKVAAVCNKIFASM